MAFLNKGEALSLTGTSGETSAAYLMAAGVCQVVLTAGGEGALLADASGIVTVPSAPAAVIDTTGAGDTFMAVAIASAARRTGRLDQRAISDAARASAITVSRRGTRSAFPTSAELAEILSG
jgi:ribokinase